jgi:dinuclear metal center YbgI/SA1388 family protein
VGTALRVRDLLDALARRAPVEKAAAWDPVGLQLGDPGAPVRAIAVCHEVTEAVLGSLEEDRVDLLVTYHPLLFRPVRNLVAGSGAGGRAFRLIRADVALACAHTNFDVAPGGAADALAESLGLRELEGFGPLYGTETEKVVTFVPEGDADRVLDAVVAAGAGTIGNYTHCSFRAAGTGTFYAAEGTDPVVGTRGELNREPEVRMEFVTPRARLEEVLSALVTAHPYEEPAYDVYARRGDAGLVGRIGAVERDLTLGALVGELADALGPAVVRFAGDPTQSVRRVAVVPGAGADFLALAAARGADAMVTGDVSHHRAREALDRGMAVVDPGHAATERPGVRRLLEFVEGLGVPCRSLLDLDPDPWGEAVASVRT